MQRVVQGHDMRDAMTLPDGKEVGFIYGWAGDPAKNYEGGYGVAHIVAKHPQFAPQDIPHIFVHGDQSGGRGRRVYSITPKKVIVTFGGKGAPGHWVLSAYEEVSPDD